MLLLGVGLGLVLDVVLEVGEVLVLELAVPDGWVVPVGVAEALDDGVVEVVSVEVVSGVDVLESVGVAVGVAVAESVGVDETSAALCPISARVSTAALAGGDPQPAVSATELVASTANTLIIPAVKNTPLMSAPIAAGFESSALTRATSLQVAFPARRSPLRYSPSPHYPWLPLQLLSCARSTPKLHDRVMRCIPIGL